MPRRPPRSNGRTGRRNVLAAVATGVAGIGLGVNVLRPSAYTSAGLDRSSNVAVAGDTDGALLGLLVADAVQKNKRSLLVEVTNNADQRLTLDVALDDPTQGTLYGPDGDGSSVTFALDPGGTADVYIETGASKGTTIPFSIRHDDADMSFVVNRQTTVESGNSSGEVSIDKLTGFKSNDAADEWEVKELRVSSTNHDLDTVELEVREQDSGALVGTKTYDVSGTTFTRSGNGNDPGVVIQPDDGNYTVSKKGYELTVVATDTAGNFARATDTW